MLGATSFGCSTCPASAHTSPSVRFNPTNPSNQQHAVDIGPSYTSEAAFKHYHAADGDEILIRPDGVPGLGNLFLDLELEAVSGGQVDVLVDEVAELALFASKEEEKRRDRIITALVRLAQLGRAAGIYLEICGQRFGSELGKGITMLRAQLTGRTAHRVNDETSANMAFGDVAPDAVLATIQIPTDRPGTAVVGDSSGGWVRIRTPHLTLRRAVNTCNAHAHRTPEIPALDAFRPVLPPLAKTPAPAAGTAPAIA